MSNPLNGGGYAPSKRRDIEHGKRNPVGTILGSLIFILGLYWIIFRAQTRPEDTNLINELFSGENKWDVLADSAANGALAYIIGFVLVLIGLGWALKSATGRSFRDMLSL